MKRSIKPHLIQLAIALVVGYLLEMYLTWFLGLEAALLDFLWNDLGGSVTEWTFWKILVYAFFGFMIFFLFVGVHVFPFKFLYQKIYPRIIKREFYKRVEGLEDAEEAFMRGRAWRPDHPRFIGIDDVNPYRVGAIENKIVQTNSVDEFEKGRAFTVTEQYRIGSVILTISFTIVIALLIFSVKSFMQSDWIWTIVPVLVAAVILYTTAKGLYNPATGEAIFFKEWLKPSNYYKFMNVRTPKEADSKDE